MATVEQIKITTDTPIWWCVADEEFYYNSGYLECGECYVGEIGQAFTFVTEKEMKVFRATKKEYINFETNSDI